MNRIASVHWRIAGSVFRLRVGRDLRYWRAESSAPRGLNVNCGLRHFTRMPLLRAAMQPSCRGVPHQTHQSPLDPELPSDSE
ncbi:hypothetical protein VZT92_021824 [Zoarces viviparus]|uniref:Uncharacterized protein n=1 Tax=Zoarces viviparus TaxID=48416 RepID=A0AAW1E972_ZOAVI